MVLGLRLMRAASWLSDGIRGPADGLSSLEGSAVVVAASLEVAIVNVVDVVELRRQHGDAYMGVCFYHIWISKRSTLKLIALSYVAYPSTSKSPGNVFVKRDNIYHTNFSNFFKNIKINLSNLAELSNLSFRCLRTSTILFVVHDEFLYR